MRAEAVPLFLLGLAAPVASFNFGKPPPPMPDAKPTLAENFPWRDPFTSKILASFAPTCEASKTFPATQYTLHDLFEKPPRGLWPWGDGLKKFFSGREYPGSWAGLDRHMYDRNVLMMEYVDVPVKVREWIEEEERSEGEGKGLFAIFEKPKQEGDKISDRVEPAKADEVKRDDDSNLVAIFAPGAIYSTLPLWVADGSDCQDTLLDLTKYSPEPKDGSVVAWPVNQTKPKVRENKRDIEFTIKAQVLKQSEDAKASIADETEPEAPKSAAEQAEAPVKDEL